MARTKKNAAKANSDGPDEQEFHSVEEVEKLLRDIKDNLKGTKSNTPEGLPEMLMGLTAAVATLVSRLRDIPKASIERERVLEDELDDGRQRSMRGNLVISTTKGANYLKSEEQLVANNDDLTGYTLSLVEEKYSVKFSEQDIQDVHYLPGGKNYPTCTGSLLTG